MYNICICHAFNLHMLTFVLLLFNLQSVLKLCKYLKKEADSTIEGCKLKIGETKRARTTPTHILI